MFSKNEIIDLGIIIPAYKAKFLRQTLESIANQTNNRFNLYIGNDNGDPEIEGIVDSFKNQLSLKYQNFPENLGRKNLVSHWERCIELAQNEKWIWLFSDDDIMAKECVQHFYDHSIMHPEVDLFHFNVSQIDENSQIIDNIQYNDFPKKYDICNFTKDRLNNKIQSYVVEYIFRRRKFLEVGRFQNFDLAWGSDVATCMKIGHPNGILTIPTSRVYWRASSQNISPDNSKAMVERKLRALLTYFDWLSAFCKQNQLKIGISPVLIYLRRLAAFKFNQPILRSINQIIHLATKSSHRG